jgi:biopolymer transport protein ExbD
MHTFGEQSDQFDLLPFIGILMCVLGCLLLVTLSMAAVSVGVGAAEACVPTTDVSPTSKQAVLVEWDGSTAVIHRHLERVHIKWVLPQEISIDGSTYVMVQESKNVSPEIVREMEWFVSHKGTHYILIAARPSGFDTLMRFANQFSAKGVSIGYEPLEQCRPVQLRSSTSPGLTEPRPKASDAARDAMPEIPSASSA